MDVVEDRQHRLRLPGANGTKHPRHVSSIDAQLLEVAPPAAPSPRSIVGSRPRRFGVDQPVESVDSPPSRKRFVPPIAKTLQHDLDTLVPCARAKRAVEVEHDRIDVVLA